MLGAGVAQDPAQEAGRALPLHTAHTLEAAFEMKGLSQHIREAADKAARVAQRAPPPSLISRR